MQTKVNPVTRFDFRPLITCQIKREEATWWLHGQLHAEVDESDTLFRLLLGVGCVDVVPCVFNTTATLFLGVGLAWALISREVRSSTLEHLPRMETTENNLLLFFFTNGREQENQTRELRSEREEPGAERDSWRQL